MSTEREEAIAALVLLGVTKNTATKLVDESDPQTMIRLGQYAVKKDRGPGWIVNAADAAKHGIPDWLDDSISHTIDGKQLVEPGETARPTWPLPSPDVVRTEYAPTLKRDYPSLWANVEKYTRGERLSDHLRASLAGAIRKIDCGELVDRPMCPIDDDVVDATLKQLYSDGRHPLDSLSVIDQIRLGHITFTENAKGETTHWTRNGVTREFGESAGKFDRARKAKLTHGA